MIPADQWAGFGPADIIRGNALDLPLADSSVDLIVTSPPYFALRSYRDGGEHYAGQVGSEATPAEFVDALIAATQEMVRVLKPSGSLWVNLGDKYAGGGMGGHSAGLVGTRPQGEGNSYRRVQVDVPSKSLIGVPWRYALRCIDDLGLILRAEVIWSKPNGLPESVTDRVRRSHETWFHFTTSPRYFAAVDEIREAYEPATLARNRVGRQPHTPADYADVSRGVLRDSRPAGHEGNPLGKLPGSVRTVPTSPLRVPAELGVDHFAAFPAAWPAWIIRGWSPSGVCVECGEGRRPVAEKVGTRREGGYRPDNNPLMRRPTENRTEIAASTLGMVSQFAITGYACACSTPNAPTRPAVVLDPFGGTGTTAMAARALGRHGISVDLSADYCRLARWRVKDEDELGAVRGLPRQRRKSDDDQPSLLDMLDLGEAS